MTSSWGWPRAAARGRRCTSRPCSRARRATSSLVCSVVPLPWAPGPARVDAEYRAYLDEAAERVLDEARERLPADVTASFAVRHARSAPAGLMEAAEEHDADAIVVGSSSAGVFGHVSLGSVTDGLLHSSPTPVALAPRGFRCSPGARVARVTAAFGGSGAAADLIVAAAGVAARVGASLRVASFAVRSRPPVTAGVGREADAADAGGVDARDPGRGTGRARHGQDAPVGAERPGERRRARGDLGRGGRGRGVGRRRRAGRRLQRPRPGGAGLPGSRASKIVRHSPVPVVVVPRGAAAELADDAVRAAP